MKIVAKAMNAKAPTRDVLRSMNIIALDVRECAFLALLYRHLVAPDSLSEMERGMLRKSLGLEPSLEAVKEAQP